MRTRTDEVGPEKLMRKRLREVGPYYDQNQMTQMILKPLVFRTRAYIVVRLAAHTTTPCTTIIIFWTNCSPTAF